MSDFRHARRDEYRAATDAVDRAVHALRARATVPPQAVDDGACAGSLARAFDRRDFLRVGTGALATALLSACGLAGNADAKRVLADVSRRNEAVEGWLFRHTAMNYGSPGARVAGAQFPTYFVSPTVPVWDAARGPWALEVSGLVARKAILSLEALMALPATEQRVDHFCVEGWNAVATFRGVRVSELARLVGAAPDARFVDFQSFDSGYHESWDMESAMHDQTLVVYAKDSALLTPPFGAPARLHSPVKLGYKNTKYLTRVAFMRERNGGYWTDRGYEWYGGT